MHHDHAQLLLETRLATECYYMSRQSVDSLDRPLTEPGEIGAHETWWVERQEALELAGYMLRPRYHPNWKPSWAGTNKFHFRCEDGLSQTVSVGDRFFSLHCLR
jgi:hypothetical protein